MMKNPSPEYKTWVMMKQRCLNPHAYAYERYGGRGITVCDRWLRFDNFLADMGKRPDGMTLDRINNNGSYEPGNCRWVNRKDQARNTRNNVLVTAFGRTQILVKWADEVGISDAAIWMRLFRYGWTPEDAVSIPVGVRTRWTQRKDRNEEDRRSGTGRDSRCGRVSGV